MLSVPNGVLRLAPSACACHRLVPPPTLLIETVWPGIASELTVRPWCSMRTASPGVVRRSAVRNGRTEFLLEERDLLCRRQRPLVRRLRLAPSASRQDEPESGNNSCARGGDGDQPATVTKDAHATFPSTTGVLTRGTEPSGGPSSLVR